MNKTALILYLIAFVAELAGWAIVFFDVKSRVARLKGFTQPSVPPSPMIYNEDPRVAALRASQGLELAEEQLRAALNEVIAAIAANREATLAVDQQLARLAGVGQKTRRLWYAVALLFVGVVLGGVGNLASSSGAGADRLSCTFLTNGAAIGDATGAVECE